jgi:hypothetical protein
MTLPTKPHLPVSVLGHPTFTVNLDSFRITDTRALHNDTDYVSLTVLLKSAASTGTPQTQVTYIGNVNNGTHYVGLAIPDLHIDPTQTLIFNYIVINYGTGHNVQDLVKNGIKQIGEILAGYGLVTGGTNLARPPLPGIGSLLQSANQWLTGLSLLAGNPSCDGFVAVEQVTLTYPDLLAHTASGPYQHETPHPGYDSAWGCGRNSMYYVDWHVSRKANIDLPPIHTGPIQTA